MQIKAEENIELRGFRPGATNQARGIWVTNESPDLRPMTTDSEHAPQSLYCRVVYVLGRSPVQWAAVSSDVQYEVEPRSSEDSNQADLAASSIERRHYDAMLPSLNLPDRSQLRLTLDLILGIPYVLMLWGIDALRVFPGRIASVFDRTAVVNRHEKRRKKREASE